MFCSRLSGRWAKTVLADRRGPNRVSRYMACVSSSCTPAVLVALRPMDQVCRQRRKRRQAASSSRSPQVVPLREKALGIS